MHRVLKELRDLIYEIIFDYSDFTSLRKNELYRLGSQSLQSGLRSFQQFLNRFQETFDE